MGHYEINPLKITKWAILRIQNANGPSAQNRDFSRGLRLYLGPLNGTSDSEGHFGAKKVEGPSKSRDFVQRDRFESLKWPI